MKSLKEKYDYNNIQSTGFSYGYCAGVRYYQGYGNSVEPVDKKKHNQYIDDMKIQAKKGRKYAKGFMCGIRDAANERKAKNN